MPHISGHEFWKSWSTACTLTKKFIWRYRPPHFDRWNYFRGYYNKKMLSDMSSEEERSKWPMKQPRKFPKHLLLCSCCALELLLREKCHLTSSTSRYVAHFSKVQVKGYQKYLLHLGKRNLHQETPSSGLARGR